MAIEDAAVLGNLFSHLSDRSQIAPLLHAYEQLRLPRTSDTQASSRLNQKIFHLPDGPDQQRRDSEMREAMEAELRSLKDGVIKHRALDNPNQWADKTKSYVQFAYDADAEAERWWNEVGEREIGNPSLKAKL